MEATIEMPVSEAEINKKAKRNLLYIGIISIVIFFGGFTSAYIVRQEKGEWLRFDIPFMFWVSTIIIVLSSITMFWATVSIKKGQLKTVKTAMLMTLLLGVGFVYSQYKGYVSLHDQGVYLTGKGSNVSGSFFYLITFMHLLHLLVGILALLVVYFKSLMEKYSPTNNNGLVICAIYWHFLDILWVYLFLFLYIIR